MKESVKINPYWLLLKDLSMEEKLSLIQLLVQSLQAAPAQPPKKKKRTPNSQNNWVQSFSGSWNDFPESAEEMILLIENARTLGRPIETL